MARVKTSGIITEIVGSVGGSTFQRSRSGLVMKNKPHGQHANTVNRSVMTNITHSLQHQWMGLTDTQRHIWNNFALYKKVPQTNNPDYFLNGHQVYIKYNSYRLLVGKAVQNNCLYGFPTLSPLSITLWIAGAGLVITGSRNFDSTKEFLVLMITYPVPASISNPGSRYRYIPFTYASGGSTFIYDAYISVFGREPVVGETVFMKYRLVDVIGLFVLPWRYDRVTFT